MTRLRIAGAALLALALSACGGRMIPPAAERAPPVAARGGKPYRPTTGSIGRRPERSAGPVRIVPAVPLLATPVAVPPNAATGRTAGVVAGPAIATLPIVEAQAEPVVAAFAASCPGLVRRTDASGLTQGADWQGACDAARAVQPGGARAFLARWLETVQVGDGRAFATGYYEPEIDGAREMHDGYVPVYARPDDLVDVDLGQFSDSLKGRKIRGRVDGTRFVPYYDRAAIDAGAIDGRARVLAWAADPVELFFLQVQGSGRIRFADGQALRVGYDTQNGRDYTGIGALMKARGLLGPGQSSMQGIVQYLHDHPVEGRAIMDENRSFVFFRVLDGPPVGALGYAVTGQVSAAADQRFVPLGAPVFLSMDRADATGLWVAQDTGGAIKGANRFDTFWGAGADAAAVAGGMAAHGTAFVLVPVGTLARLNAGVGRADAIP